MAYQETTRQSYGSKVKGSFQGILWGIILIIAGTIVLWWNEGRAVKSANALKDFQKNYVELTDINTVDPSFEGKAIHATGVATTEEILRDANFGIAVNAFRLCRDVEYYQWTEQSESKSKDKLGGATETTTTYTYEPEWCSEPVNSAEFKDPDYKGKNFVWRVVEDADQYASNATFGAYRLNESIIHSISGEEPVQPNLSEEQMKQLLAKVTDSTVVVTVSGNQVYIGADPDSPHIGDVRISFNQVTSPKTISILEKVVNGTFESYIAKNGKAFSKVEMGTVSAMNMIEHQKSANKMWLWVLRIIGILLVVGGFRSLLNFISTVFAVVPFVQKIIGAGVGVVTTLVGLVWSLVVIAIAWVAYRPVLAISLLVVAAALIVWLVTRSRKKKLNNVAALLVILLMIGAAGCTGQTKGGDGNVASSDVKGPVKTVTVTEYYYEGEPDITIFHYDQAGKLVSQEEHNWEGEGDYAVIESLSEKDAEGRYTKQVWGNDGNPESINFYEYDEAGRTTYTAYAQPDGEIMTSTRNHYNADGKMTLSVTSSSYGTYTNSYEYDGKGQLSKSTSAFNGEVSNITAYAYDEAGREIWHEEILPSQPRTYKYCTSYNAKGEINGNKSIITENGKSWISTSDTTFTDKNGLRHDRTYACYDDAEPRTYEATYNKQGVVTHYEFFNGNASQPTTVIDFKLAPDGHSLREMEWKDLMLGQVTDTRVRKYSELVDSFGNWTQHTEGLRYNMDIFYMHFEDVANMMSTTYREIEYYGEDQGQNYGFEGKAGQASVCLSCTNDHGVYAGELQIDGNVWRAVGTSNADGLLTFVALEENGNIPWTLTIPAGDGKREGTLHQGGNEMKVTLSPFHKDLKTYSFSTRRDDLVGIYQYEYPGDKGTGVLDVWRGGDNWENLMINIKCTGPAPSFNMAKDEFSEYFGDSEETDVYRYLWNDDNGESLDYTIRFFDTFAVIILGNGNPSAFFGMNVSVAGIYAKLPSVG